jgi:epoxyqueuosine reductase
MPRRLTIWQPPSEVKALMPNVSGNIVNGLGETEARPPSPFFWHPPNEQPFGAMQDHVLQKMLGQPDSGPVAEAFQVGAPGQFRRRGPAPIAVAQTRTEKSANDWSKAVVDFALANHADVAGIASMDPLWVFDGYCIEEPWVIIVGVAHDYGEFAEAPSVPGNNRSIVEVGKQYTRAAIAANTLANFIRTNGYQATAHEGPMGKALLMIPAAIAAGLGELGKHGSLINRTHGSSFRLSAVTTDMPLVPHCPDVFGADQFCSNCQICSDACPPAAIADGKQMVRGVEKWYVDFDKCIPFFAETRGCGICAAVCPWSRPAVRETLLVKMARRHVSA